MPRYFSTLIFALISLGFLGVMVFAPLWALTVYDDGNSSWWVIQDDYVQQRIIWTITQALITCALTVLLALPVAWVLARLDFMGRRLILRLLMLPFVMPTLVAAMGVLALFGTQGILTAGWQDTPYLLLYGNVFFNLPVMVRAAYQGFCQVPAVRLYAAQTLGANTWQRFWQVERPVLLPWLAGGLCLVFLYCFSGFGLALLLGGTAYSTIEVEIYRLITMELDMAQASVLVWLMLAITALAGGVYALLSNKVSRANITQPLMPQAPTHLTHYVLLWAALAILLLCCVLPLGAVLWKALHAGSSWAVLWQDDTWAALWNTVRFTTGAMLGAMVLGISHAALARRIQWIRGITFLPFMVSPVCVAFGVLLLYPDWTASLPLLLATYALLAYPFITKDMLATWDALPPNYLAAARSLGANTWQATRWLTIPLLLPALRRGLTLAAATCVGEFAATLFLSRPEWQTLTTLIYQYLGTAGADNHDKAMVLTVVLMGLALMVFVVLDADETSYRATEKRSI